MTPTQPPPDEEALAGALADYHRRQAAGESVWVGQYDEGLGPLRAEFRRLVEVEESLDLTLENPPGLKLPHDFGRYRLEEQVGQGGMGVVYRATDRQLRRTVAVKVLHAGIAHGDAVAREHFRKEAKLCARVRHDHIVVIHDAGENGGQLFYAMDYLPGDSLEARIRRGERFEPRALAAALKKIAEALQAVHAQGTVHRDVKPGNIMVTPEGKFVLTDFGLARNVEDKRITRTGQALGSFHYMSPEQLRGEKNGVGAPSDVYGLGSVLYEALTGQTPFQTESREALYRMILHERPRPPRELDPSIPERLESIVLVALQKRPEDRYATAAAMAEDLQHFLDDEPTRVPVGRFVHALRWARAHAKHLAAAALVLAGAALGASAWWNARPAQLTLQYDESVGSSKASVTIDGAYRGEAGAEPLRLTLEPGHYVLEAKLPGHGPERRKFTLRAGQDFALELRYGEPQTPAAASALRAAVDLAELPAAPGTRAAGPAAPALSVLAPRGAVRLTDLAQGWIVDLEEWSGGGELVLSRGAEELWREAFAPDLVPDQSLVRGRFPDQVLARLAPGDLLTFSWEPASGGLEAPARAESSVATGDPAGPALARIERLLIPESAFAAQLRVEALFARQLLSAALGEALEAVRAHPQERALWDQIDRLMVRIDGSTRFSRDVLSHLVHGYPTPPLGPPSGAPPR